MISERDDKARVFLCLCQNKNGDPETWVIIHNDVLLFNRNLGLTIEDHITGLPPEINVSTALINEANTSLWDTFDRSVYLQHNDISSLLKKLDKGSAGCFELFNHIVELFEELYGCDKDNRQMSLI